MKLNRSRSTTEVHTPTNNKQIIIYVLFGIVSLFLVSRLANLKESFDPRSKAQISPVKFYLTPAAAVVPPNRTIKLMIDGKDEKIVFTRVELTFDSNKIMLVNNIATTDKLRTIIKKSTIDEANATGRIKLILALAAADKANPPVGAYELAQFTIAPKISSYSTSDIHIDTSAMQVVNWDASEMVTEHANMKITLNPATGGAYINPTATVYVEPTEEEYNEDEFEYPTNTPYIYQSPIPVEYSPYPEFTPEPVPIPIPDRENFEGDMNGDECVNFTDIGMCLHVLWPFGAKSCDANRDGLSNFYDLFFIITRLGNGCVR